MIDNILADSLRARTEWIIAAVQSVTNICFHFQLIALRIRIGYLHLILNSIELLSDVLAVFMF